MIRGNGVLTNTAKVNKSESTHVTLPAQVRLTVAIWLASSPATLATPYGEGQVSLRFVLPGAQ